jgi:hypothetical protein
MDNKCSHVLLSGWRKGKLCGKESVVDMYGNYCKTCSRLVIQDKLLEAVKKLDFDSCCRFLELGANPDHIYKTSNHRKYQQHKNNEYKATALSFATSRYFKDEKRIINLKIIQLLLKYGANVDSCYCQYIDDTLAINYPVQFAIQFKDIDLLKILLDTGAEVTDGDGCLEAFDIDTFVIDLLYELKDGLDDDSENAKEMSENVKEILTMLINAGINIDNLNYHNYDNDEINNFLQSITTSAKDRRKIFHDNIKPQM